jgi:hypothetical protein
MRRVDVGLAAGYSKVTVPHIWPTRAALLQCRPHRWLVAAIQ